MTWEETIEYIQNDPNYAYLVEKAYYNKDNEQNIRDFGDSDEFVNTMKLINKYKPNAKSILDIGCGNGISAVNFALSGFEVYAVEPDNSTKVGSGAIALLKEKYELNKLKIYNAFAENLSFANNSFDVVYCRQAMHHANNLNDFILNSTKGLKQGGLFLAIRDHVVYNQEDKKWFLKEHLLHRFYGGENAFTEKQYVTAIENAGMKIQKIIKYYDSSINYFPNTEKDIDEIVRNFKEKKIKKLHQKIGILSRFNVVQKVFFHYLKLQNVKPLDESLVPGRMYSFVAIKQ